MNIKPEGHKIIICNAQTLVDLICGILTEMWYPKKICDLKACLSEGILYYYTNKIYTLT